MPNYIALAIPFFFLLIGVELLAARAKGVKPYRLSDSVVDLSCGITQQVLAIFFIGALVAVYGYCYEHWRLVTFSSTSAWPWLIAFVLVDFTYYWWHRLSHEVNFLWAAHVVHHQSEDYNLAVALRQSVVTVATILPFHLPLAFLGISPVVFVTVDSFSTLYQFWIHTELVGKLGWFERIFNTPSQHRVHHAVNPRYLDKNYAATLCVWDRFFGTFEEEAEPCVYGLVKPLNNFNPMWAQVHRWVELWQQARAEKTLAGKLRVWVAPPTFAGTGLPDHVPPAVDRATAVKHDPQVSPRLARWLFAQLALTVVAATALLFFAARLTPAQRFCTAALILITLLAAGGLIERRRWAMPLEIGRWAALGAVALLWLTRAL
jgi:sterol desaturase/sphingolipid hydroxylase (fatty acid hydroxylase superfamily)